MRKRTTLTTMSGAAISVAIPLLLLACSRPGAAGTYFFDARDDAAKATLPGAEKVLLTLKPDGTLSMDAGPMNLLSTTWKEENGQVTFGQGQGLIGAEYRYRDGALIPFERGKEGTAWRFTKK